MNTQVVAITNRKPTEPYYIFDKFVASLTRFGVEPTILGWHEHWHGLMTKPRHLRKWLRDKKNKADILIVCDAWDIVFTAHPDEIVETYKKHFDGYLVFNAERSCFPRGDLAPRFPDQGTPWRYLNSGFMIGPAPFILTLLEHMALDAIPDDHKRPDGSWFHPNDQEHYMLGFLDQPVPMVLDTRCILCQSCSGSTIEEFDIDTLKNRITGTHPYVFHFNGGSKNDVMPVILNKLCL